MLSDNVEPSRGIRPPLVPAAIALASVVALATAYISQHGFGLEPCELCIWQRYPYYAAVGLGLLGALVPRAPAVRRAAVALAALVFMTGAGLAGFHVGVEQGWWQGLPGCQVPAIGAGMTVAELRAVIEARERVVPCDEPAWTFLGISMAGYNGLYSLALAVVSAWAVLARRA